MQGRHPPKGAAERKQCRSGNMNNLKSIVVGIDFTPCSASALKQALRIAKRDAARLRAVHVVDTVVVRFHERLLTGLQKEIRAGVLQNARDEWAEVTKGIPEAAGLDLAIEINSAEMMMTRWLLEKRTDLLVIGTHGASRTDEGLGMLAAACLRKARAKVMLVREAHCGPFRSVVACVDLSDTSRTVLEQAARVAVQDNATLHIVHVCCAPRRSTNAPAFIRRGAPAGLADDHDALLHRLEQFAEPSRAEMGNIKPLYTLCVAPTQEQGVIESARQLNADLVVLGARAKMGLREVLWGSTAENVILKTSCSILAVKPPAFEEPNRVLDPAAWTGEGGSELAPAGGTPASEHA